jgi:AbrB family looped-hinge helix DNA binding protein
MAEATLSSKNQVVIPRDVRKALGLKAGDKLLFVLRGEHLIVLPKPKSFAQATRGLARGKYGRDYLKKERESWD